jgi:hypothetical protein
MYVKDNNKQLDSFSEDMAGSCECGDEPSNSIKVGRFLL